MRELANSWMLPIAGMTIARCCFDWGVALELSGTGTSGATIRISSEFSIHDSGGERWTLGIGSGTGSLAPVLTMIGLTVSRAEANKNGTLDVLFTDGSRLRVPPDSRYEAWEFTGERGAKAVSLPGGDIAIWRSAA
jgi:hypothetical protein